MRKIIPGAEHIDNMRRILSRIEMAFMDDELPSSIDLSSMLIGLEGSQRELEVSLNAEYGNSLETALDISRLPAFESHGIC